MKESVSLLELCEVTTPVEALMWSRNHLTHAGIFHLKTYNFNLQLIFWAFQEYTVWFLVTKLLCFKRNLVLCWFNKWGKLTGQKFYEKEGWVKRTERMVSSKCHMSWWAGTYWAHWAYFYHLKGRVIVPAPSSVRMLCVAQHRQPAARIQSRKEDG